MRFFIQIKDGKPFEHPIHEVNFRDAFPNVDVDNLPPEFTESVRIPPPDISIYQRYKGVSYEFFNGVVTDVHSVYNMTNEEKQAVDEEFRAIAAERLAKSQSEKIGVSRV